MIRTFPLSALVLGAIACTAEVDAAHEHDLEATTTPPCCEIPSAAEAMLAANDGAAADADDEPEAGDADIDHLAEAFGVTEVPLGDDGSGLPDHGPLPMFELMADDASTFTRDDLIGDLWVVDFIFTRCAGPCPAMSRIFADLQDEDLPARFLSVTVDPAYDSPQVLSQYRTAYGGESDDWRLLTGSHAGIQALADEGFRLPVNAGTETSVEGMPPMFHSGKFALVDRSGHVRGYYVYTDELALQQLRDDIETLAALP